MNEHHSISAPPSVQRNITSPSKPHRRRAAFLAALMIGTMALVSVPAIGGGVVDTILNVVNRIESKVNQIRSNVGTTASQVSNLPQTVQKRMGLSFDGEMTAKLRQPIDDLRTTLDQTNMQLEAFGDGSPGTECFSFRGDLTALVEGTGNLTDALLGIVAVSKPRIGRLRNDTRDLVDIIEAMPCPVLMPMSIAFSEGTPLGTVATAFLDTVAAVDAVASLYERAPGRGDALACDTIVDDQSRYTGAAITLASAALLFKTISAIVDSDDMIGGGQLSASVNISDAAVGLWGFANVSLSPPKWRRRIANAFDTAFELSLAASTFTSNRVRHCVLKVNQQGLMAQQQDIMREICTVTRFRSEACRALPAGIAQ